MSIESYRPYNVNRVLQWRQQWLSVVRRRSVAVTPAVTVSGHEAPSANNNNYHLHGTCIKLTPHLIILMCKVESWFLFLDYLIFLPCLQYFSHFNKVVNKFNKFSSRRGVGMRCDGSRYGGPVTLNQTHPLVELRPVTPDLTHPSMELRIVAPQPTAPLVIQLL